MYRLLYIFLCIASINTYDLNAQLLPGEDNFITTNKEKNCFTLSAAGKSAPLLINSGDFAGVKRTFKDLQSDIGKVTSSVPLLYIDTIPKAKEIVISGTIGKSPIIDKLIRDKKNNVSNVTGKWESYLIQVINKPFPGVKKALVIAGSDKRGTIYGIYEISEKTGVSPWYWWADVPVIHKDAFNEDDPENPKLADEYGIVMGNSHQEPMLRAQKEWDRRYQKTLGSWNYAKNPDVLENFWKEGIRRNSQYESIVTIGLGGANDTEMAPG